ncbi:MAG: type IV secretion system protein, partial [Akkermansiaceae bacterium]|nr:type IV secretion system protein [Akkermansiaceae bacterium]
MNLTFNLENPGSRSPRVVGSMLIWGALLVLLAAPARADRTVTAVTPRTTQYILDADAGTQRDYNLLKGTVTVHYAGILDSINTRVRLSLLDDNEQEIPLAAGSDLTSTYNPGALGGKQAVDHTFDFALDPTSRLDSDRLYRVHAQVEEYVQLDPRLPPRWRTDLGVVLDSTARRYYHFTNTVGSDPEHNVIAVVEAVTITRDWRIRTLANDNQNFRATASVRLLRYDQMGVQAPPDELLPFKLRLGLVNDLNNPTTLSYPGSGTVSFSQQMSPFTTGLLPFEMVKTLTFSFRPGTQLDPVNRRYLLNAEVWAEPAPGQAEVRLSGLSSAQIRLLDYNGNLRFGSGATAVTAVMTNAARTTNPYLPMPILLPTYLQAEVNLTTVTVTGGDATFTASPGIVGIRLLSSGLATYNDTATLTFTNPAGNTTQTTSYQGIEYLIGPQLSVTATGGTGTITIGSLPAGMGITWGASAPTAGDTIFSNLPGQTNVPLNASLAPAGTVSWPFPTGRWVIEETKPVAVRVTGINWLPNEGRFDLVASGEVHHPETAMRQVLAASPTTSPVLPDREKRSNNDYWLLALGVNLLQPANIRQDPGDSRASANASLNIDFNIGQGIVKTHFPEADLYVNSNSNHIRVADDLLVPASSYLGTVNVYVPYLAGDPEATPGACGGAASVITTASLRPSTTSNRLYFTPTGGLRAPCATIAAGGHALKWGYLGGTQYAFATDAFQTLTFYMPGTFYPQAGLNLGGSDLAHQFTPIAIHTCGYVDGFWRFQDMEPSSTPQYNTNSLRADYAGSNARVAGEAAGFKGWSIISGQNAGSYPLKPECRYYARKSGVTGIHDALGGPTEAVLYGFQATFSSYGLAFRDSRVTHSVTNGAIVVPYPSKIFLELDSIRFSTTGRPLDAKLPSSTGVLKLEYWNCKMTPTALSFSSTDPCDTTAGLLRLQAGVEMPNLGQTLYGELGFSSNGQIATDSDSGLTSRLKAPNHVTFRGPQITETQAESYNLTPVTDVYLNDYAAYPSTTPQGFLNLAGRLDVAFFNDLNVHVQTTAGVAGQEGAAPLYVTGGWTENPGIPATEATFFTNPTGFDATNRGFPDGISLNTYRTSATYYPVAHRQWMDVVNFTYPLLWDNGDRSFRSPDDFNGDVDLLVLKAKHRLKYLSAEQAELEFGASYSGIPEINLGNMLVNAIEENTGAFSALEAAIGNGAGALLLSGSEAMAGLLNDSMDDYFGPVLEVELTPLMHTAILDRLDKTDRSLSGTWETELNAIFTGDAWLQDAVRKLGVGATNTPPPYLVAARDAIDKAVRGIEVFIGHQGPPGDVTGLLETDDNGNYTLGGRLVFQLIDMMASEELKGLLGIRPGSPAEIALNQQVTRYLNKYAPSLGTIKAQLTRLRDQLLQVKAGLNDAGLLANFLKAQLNTPAMNAELNALVLAVKGDIITHINAQYAGNPASFATQANRDATAAFIVRRVRDKVATGAIAMALQNLLREQLQDLQAAIDQTVGSMFSNFNRIIRAVIADVAAPLNDVVNGLTGELGTVVKAGSIDGSATIRGDRLDHLRLDVNLELELDEPIKFAGFLEINQMEVGGPYGNAREIQ